MKLTIVDHPLCAVRLSIMRDKHSTNAVFRDALRDITQFLVYEAARTLALEQIIVETPLTKAQGSVLAAPPLLVPVLRAGLGMVDQAHALIPEASVGFIGLVRNEHTHEPEHYFDSLPEDLSSASVFVLDPMLATGGSMVKTVDLLAQRGASNITIICVIASPVGVQTLAQHSNIDRLFVAAVDEKLNEHAFIYPGLGDAGDRQFGTQKKTL